MSVLINIQNYQLLFLPIQALKQKAKKNSFRVEMGPQPRRAPVKVDTSKARSNIDVLRLCLRDLGWREVRDCCCREGGVRCQTGREGLPLKRESCQAGRMGPQSRRAPVKVDTSKARSNIGVIHRNHKTIEPFHLETCGIHIKKRIFQPETLLEICEPLHCMMYSGCVSGTSAGGR